MTRNEQRERRQTRRSSIERKHCAIGWSEYARRVRELEAQGCTTSDAQGIVDAQLMQGRASHV